MPCQRLLMVNTSWLQWLVHHITPQSLYTLVVRILHDLPHMQPKEHTKLLKQFQHMHQHSHSHILIHCMPTVLSMTTSSNHDTLVTNPVYISQPTLPCSLPPHIGDFIPPRYFHFKQSHRTPLWISPSIELHPLDSPWHRMPYNSALYSSHLSHTFTSIISPY